MKIKSVFRLASLALLLLPAACMKDTPPPPAANAGTVDLSTIEDDYPVSTNDKLATLGRVLFYDKSLSLNNTISCGSCHQQSRAFCDNFAVSTGLEDGKTARNTPSIFAKQGKMFWDGRAAEMEDLVLRPIKNHVEMKFSNIQQLCRKLEGISYYPTLFQKAFGSSGIDSVRLKKALAEFLRNFQFANTKFAASMMSPQILSDREREGKDLFFGKAKCSNCHHVEGGGGSFGGSSGYGFTDFEANIGLDIEYKDQGRYNITNNEADKGEFMIPVLLNVELTAPYMHDGRFKTLEEVVEHYNSGIKNHPNLSMFLRMTDGLTEEDAIALDKNHNMHLEGDELMSIPPVKLNLTSIDKRNLVEFLKTLTDPNIASDARFSDPFKMQ
jgi:cytochrome c peroxidase